MKLNLANKLEVEIVKGDHNKVNSEIRALLGTLEDKKGGFQPKSPNYKVSDPDWTNPSLYMGREVPLSDESGRLKYFVNIRNALEMLLSGLNVRDQWLEEHRCPYLEKA